jgi:hypothetical protein
MPEIRALYPDEYVIAVQSTSGMKAKKDGQARVINKEVLITNYVPDSVAVSRFGDKEIRQMRMAMEDSEDYQA